MVEYERSYRMRNDFVLVRIVTLGKSPGGVVIPDIAKEGKRLVVEGVGPKVENLKVGDVVECIGTVGQDLAKLPNDRDLFVTRESNVVLVVEFTPVEKGK